MYQHRARSSQRLSLAVAVSLTSLFAACADQANRITAPEDSPVFSGSGAGFAEISCQVAVRTAADQYVARGFTIEAPVGIVRSTDERTEFGFLEWREEVPDPVRVTVCQIPNTPAAEQWIRTTLLRGRAELNLGSPDNAGSLAGVARAAAGAHPRTLRGSRLVNTLALPEEEICPLALSGCGWEPIEEDIGPEPPPPDYTDETDLAYLDPAYSVEPLVAIISCSHQTQYPHISGFDISVHGLTRCTAPVSSITLRVALRKQRCVWIFCWMSERAATTRTSPPGFAFFDVPLHIRCEIGWWDGQTTHTVIPPAGYWPPSSTKRSYSPVSLVVRRCF